MLKLCSYITGVTLFALASCDEKGPAIDFSEYVPSSDTTYLSAPESPQLRNVLVEEATGVKCPNCPAGAKLLKAADSANSGRLVVVGLHAGKQTTPLSISKHDFRNDKLLDLYGYFGSEPNKPAAIFDRVPENGTYFIDSRNKWADMINQRLLTPTKVNLSLSSSYNPATQEDTIRLRIAYTEDVAVPQSIVILITESDIIDPQENNTWIDTFYQHNYIFRDFVTPIFGVPFLSTLPTKEAGRVYERTFIYKLPGTAFEQEGKRWNVDNCHVVAFVFNTGGDSKEVAQAAEVKFKQ